MILFLILAALCVGISVASAVGVLTSRRLRTSERLASIQEYGFTRQASEAPALAEDDRPSAVDSFVTGLGSIVAGTFSRINEENLRSELMVAGMYSTTPRMLLGYSVFTTILMPAVAVLLLGNQSTLYILLEVIMLPLGALTPITLVRRKARKRLAEIDRRLPDLIDLLCVMVEAGLGFLAAMRMAGEQFQAPLGDEIRLMLQEQTMGLGVGDALANMGRRVPSPAMGSFVRSMANGERMGISTGQIMRNLSHEMRIRRRRLAEERAQKAPVRMLFPLALLIFPSIFVVLLGPGVLQLLNTFGI